MSEENIFYCCRTDNVVKLLEYINTEGIEVVINLKDFDGWSLLHIAARWNSIKCLEILLDTARGAIDVNAKNNNEETPLYIASWYGSKECLEILLNTIPSGGAIDVDAVNNEGDTPLHEAARNNSREFMKILVDCGASSGIRNNYGETFLDLIEDKEMEEYICQLTTLHLKEPGFF